MVVSLRQAGREDSEGDGLERLFALDHACFRPGIAWPRADLQFFLRAPYSISLIAEQGGALAGFAIVELKKGVGHIATIDVDPSLRRQGVGRMLMDALTGRCLDQGAKRLLLEVAVDNQSAQAFYRKLGFTETGRIPDFYLDGLDALTMEKKIHWK